MFFVYHDSFWLFYPRSASVHSCTVTAAAFDGVILFEVDKIVPCSLDVDLVRGEREAAHLKHLLLVPLRQGITAVVGERCVGIALVFVLENPTYSAVREMAKGLSAAK